MLAGEKLGEVSALVVDVLRCLTETTVGVHSGSLDAWTSIFLGR